MTTVRARHGADYDRFARVYHLHWGSHATQVYPILDHLVLGHLPRQSAILDLCCGTGQLAALLADKGWAVTGVDISEPMIEVARANAPGVEFQVGDARDDLPARDFSAVFSIYDSLNHLMTLDELVRVFGNVYAVLSPGGYFAFDLNMAEGYESRWRGTFAHVEDDHVCVVRSSHDVGERTGTMDITLFEPEGAEWTRTDLRLAQRWYARDHIMDALRTVGFSDIRSFDAGRPIVAGGPTSLGRMYFVARREQ